MSTSTRPLTRTRVFDLTREIRREAKEIDQTVHAMHHVATKRMAGTLQDFVDSDASAYSRDRLHNLLGVIEGNAALLRELLNAED